MTEVPKRTVVWWGLGRTGDAEIDLFRETVIYNGEIELKVTDDGVSDDFILRKDRLNLYPDDMSGALCA